MVWRDGPVVLTSWSLKPRFQFALVQTRRGGIRNGFKILCWRSEAPELPKDRNPRITWLWLLVKNVYGVFFMFFEAQEEQKETLHCSLNLFFEFGPALFDCSTHAWCCSQMCSVCERHSLGTHEAFIRIHSYENAHTYSMADASTLLQTHHNSSQLAPQSDMCNPIFLG